MKDFDRDLLFWLLHRAKEFMGQAVVDGRQNCFELSIDDPHFLLPTHESFLEFSIRV